MSAKTFSGEIAINTPRQKVREALSGAESMREFFTEKWPAALQKIKPLAERA